jgi:uncharacterized protein DUF5335
METMKIPIDQLEKRFSAFTKNFLLRESTYAADIEILAPDWGDQFAMEGAQLRGITYDPKEKAIEFEVEGGDHRVVEPKEVWTVEEPDGFIKSIEIVRDDDTREVVRVNRLGLRPTS